MLQSDTRFHTRTIVVPSGVHNVGVVRVVVVIVVLRVGQSE
jgi:hypothetical protein